MMKKLVIIFLVAVFAVSVLSGCDHLSAGSKDGSNIDSQTKETSESEAVNDSSPAESSAENSTDDSSQISEKSKPTHKEALAKAKELEAECEKMVREKGVPDDKGCNYKSIVNSLEFFIKEEYNLSDEEIIERTAEDIYLHYRMVNVIDKYKAKHPEVPEKEFSESGMLITGLRFKTFRLLWIYKELELSDEKILEMLEYPIKNYPDLSYGFDYFFPMQEAQIAGVDFDSTKRITTEDIISICDSIKKIKDFDERTEYLKQELIKKQAYPDYVIISSTDHLYFFDHSNDINDKQNTIIRFASYKYPYGYYDFYAAYIDYTTTDENGNEIREHFSTTAEY